MSENETETYLAQTLHISAGADAYDTYAKALLADRQILAWILRYTVREFRNMPISEIAACIGDDLAVGDIPIDPGLTHLFPHAGSAAGYHYQYPHRRKHAAGL